MSFSTSSRAQSVFSRHFYICIFYTCTALFLSQVYLFQSPCSHDHLTCVLNCAIPPVVVKNSLNLCVKDVAERAPRPHLRCYNQISWIIYGVKFTNKTLTFLYHELFSLKMYLLQEMSFLFCYIFNFGGDFFSKIQMCRHLSQLFAPIYASNHITK